MRIAILNTRVRILSIPKVYLPLWTHDLIRLMYSPNRTTLVPSEPFFYLTENSVEWCVVASIEAFEAGFTIPRQARLQNIPGKTHSLTRDVYYVVQVENDDENTDSGRPILEMTAAFAGANITIMYISTYQTDFMLIKQTDFQKAHDIWLESDYDIVGLNELAPWLHDLPPPRMPRTTSINQDLPVASGFANLAISEVEGGPREGLSTVPSFEQSRAATPPQPARLVMTDFRVRQMGLSYSRRREWIYNLIHALFLPETMGLSSRESRFISYVVADEEISLIAPPHIINCLGSDHIRHHSQITYHRLFEIFYRNNLSRSGLVYDVSELMNEADIELMYITTYHTACIVVRESDFAAARVILDSHEHVQNTDDGGDSSDEYADDSLAA
ncbi:hypothetical protein H4R33_004594 [Dimargaris cristalligena]|nr:hypothetical protein H4R33_004594 [Dimargaris cristalligena]